MRRNEGPACRAEGREYNLPCDDDDDDDDDNDSNNDNDNNDENVFTCFFDFDDADEDRYKIQSVSQKEKCLHP